MNLDVWQNRLSRAGVLVGLFCVLLTLQIPQAARATDVSVYFVRKGFEFTQVDAGLPSINATNGDAFDAEVYMSAANFVTNGSVQPPLSLPMQVLVPTTSQTKLSYKKKYNTLTALDTHYPNGAYTLTMQGRNDGTRQATVQVQGNSYPAGPWVQNFIALQAMNANGYILVSWGPFGGGTASDFTQFRIEDLAGNKIFETPDFGKPGALDGTATHVLLAPGVLASGVTYRGLLQFQKNIALDTASYPGALGAAAYYARTTFNPVTTTAVAPDVKSVEVYKKTRWVQTGPNALSLDPGQEFTFDTSVKAYATGILTTATVTLPPNASSPLRNLVMQPGGTTLEFYDIAASADLLNGLYTNGTYAVAFDTPHDGNKSINLELPADAYPPAPRFANFDVLQMVNANHPFVVSWDPWVGGGIGDFIQVRIEDLNFNKIYATPDFGKTGYLDGRATSTVIPAGALPAGQGYEVHITFNKIISLDTVTYPGVLAFSDFQARTKMHVEAEAADVDSYSVFKYHQFSQPDSGQPVPYAPSPDWFEAYLVAAGSNWVTSAAFSSPLGAGPALTPLGTGVQYFFGTGFSTQSGMDAAFPDGNYAMAVTGANDGYKVLPLTLTTDLYPNAPHITGFFAAETLNSSADFNLVWDAFAGGTGTDYVQVLVFDGPSLVFQTPSYGTPGALTGLTISGLIPAGTLMPNRAYSGALLFKKITALDTTTYPGAVGVAGYSSSTRFPLVTRGPGNPPVLSLTQVRSNNQWLVSAQVVPTLSYRIEGSSNLLQWLPLTTNTASSNVLQWQDPVNRSSFFYRSMVLP